MIMRFLKKYFMTSDEFKAIHDHIDCMEAHLTENQQRISEMQQRMEEQQQRMEDVQKWINILVNSCEHKIQLFMGNWQMEVMSRYGETSGSKFVRHIKGLRSLLKVKAISAKDGKLIRTGNANDGGYVMLEGVDRSKVAYSFGISDDVTWDKFMADRGFDVYMYDHTIEGLPEENDKFHWQKIGVCGEYDENQPELRTIPMLLKDNGHLETRHMIMKMDIEGAEWSSLRILQTAQLEQFDQILLELHDMNNMSNYEVMMEVLAKLNESHQLVHVHGNNYASYVMIEGMVMPNVIEVTYLKRDLCEFEDSDECFPNELDYPNNNLSPDIFMGKWK